MTDEQRQAADHAGRHLLIVAGAGTGKTTTLASRMVSLVTRGVAPERILLLTFSRRAAAELLRRSEALGGRDLSRRCWGGTFHGIGNRLLRRHGHAIGLEPGFTVLDQGDTADLLALVRAELHAHDATDTSDRRRARKDTMAAVLSRVVNTARPLSQVLAADFPWCTDDRDELRAVFAAYTARKRAAQVLDYDDLLLCWSALLRDPSTARVLRAQFDHVLVDEYQDTNTLQADLLADLAVGGATVTAVGDDAQAIYSFRAATQRNILDFPERFGADVVLLERNHRSTPSILDTANAVIEEAAHRHPKVLRAERADGPRPALVTCGDEGAQSAAVCARLLQHHEQGVAFRDQAVLFRTSHHSDLLELELTARRIPYVKYGGLKFLEAAHVKDLVCGLRLVENPRDELAWFRVLQLLEGVGPATARKLSTTATQRPITDVDAPIAGELFATLDDARGHAEASTPGVAVERMRAWLEPLLERRYPDIAARVADLDQLQLAAEAAPTFSRFLADLTLDPPAATSDLAGPPHLDDDVLTLSTIHSAKGGEWDVVHVLQVTDGSIPSDMATGNEESIEEERRLLYVAVTRARDRLFLYAPLRYHFGLGRAGFDDRHGYSQLSRFLTAGVLATVDRVGDPGAEPDARRCSPAGSAALADVDAMVGALFDG
jgi:DNA helicase-2/ATP-dependent DNA helicase PcrA